jgi:cytochrome c-type biogenesis protein CcmF
MIALLGHVSILAALLTAVGGAISCFVPSERGAAWGRRAAFGVLGLVALAVLLMEIALVTHDFAVKYVAEVGSRETPLYYTVISLWAALEGSILFWAFLLAVYTFAFVILTPQPGRRPLTPRPHRTPHPPAPSPSRGEGEAIPPQLLPSPLEGEGPGVRGSRPGVRGYSQDLQRHATGILLGISSFFLFVIAGPGDPFVPLNPVPADGPGPNVLLQNHPMMGLHPPMLYAGYVGLAVPFAIAIASLLRGSPGPEAFRLIRRWSLVPWICLSLGIVAGMWWSYAVLGWGGYWSWDPVENASVMPWLVTTAFLHSLQVQERRQMLKTWTISLIVAAFLLSVLGTFLTRSGVLASVHSFTQSAVGPLFLGFFGAVLVGSLGLIFTRSRELVSPGTLDAAICRETAFLFNNLLFVAITFTILLGTLFPLIADALQGSQLSVGAPYFNHLAVPIGFALLFLMGIGPALPWGAARLDELQYRLLVPVAMGVAVILGLLVIGVRGIGALATFGAAAFVLAVTVGRILADVRARRHGTGEGRTAAARRLLGANPRRYGGYLAHVGVLLVLVGIAASQSYQVRTLVSLRPGQTVSVDGYALRYRGWQPLLQTGRMVTQARLDLSREGTALGTLSPSQNFYVGRDQAVVTPAVREEPFDMISGLFQGKIPLSDLGQVLRGRNPFEDVYVVLDGVTSSPRGPVTLQVLVNPMVGFIWLGGLVVGLGGVVALIPARRRRAPLGAREAAPRAGAPSREPEEALA